MPPDASSCAQDRPTPPSLPVPGMRGPVGSRDERRSPSRGAVRRRHEALRRLRGRGRHLLRRCPRGSIFGILGSNGAGKTTSIRMLMNILRARRGRDRGARRARRRALEGPHRLPARGARSLQEDAHPRAAPLLRPHQGPRPPRSSTSGSTTGSTAWASRTGAHGRVEELSKGMAQKLQFVVTVVHAPDLLVLDEPFAGLDPVNRDVLRDAILEMRSDGHDRGLLDARHGAGRAALRPADHDPRRPR